MFGGMGKKFGVCRHAFLWIWKSRVKSVPDYPISHFCIVSHILKHIHKVTHIQAHLPTLRFRYIQDPGITFRFK